MKKIKVAKTTIQAMELVSSFIEAITKNKYQEPEIQGIVDIAGSMVALPLAELKVFIESIREAMVDNPDGFIMRELDEDNYEEKREYYDNVTRTISIDDMIKTLMVTEDPSAYLKSKGIDDSFLPEEIRSRGKIILTKHIPTEEEEINEMLDNMLRRREWEEDVNRKRK